MRASEDVRARGGCHCGAVRFEVRGPIRDVMVCHCSDCRRIHGHLAAHSATRWSDLAFSRQDGLKWYASSALARRGFCAACGSALFYDLHGRDIVSLSAGALDQPTGIEIALHVFQGSAADYEASDAAAPRLNGPPDPAHRVVFRP